MSRFDRRHRAVRLALVGCIPLLAALALFLGVERSEAQQPPTRRFIPIGAAYERPTRELFVRQAIAHNRDATVQIRVLMATFNETSSVTITQQEREENITAALNRANQLLLTCDDLVVSPTTCNVTLPDIQIRSDALNPENAQLVAGPDTDGIYILGGDQVIAMEVIANTPVEAAMEARYNEGVPIAGNSAGLAVQSRYMIAGYTGDNFPWHGLQFDSVALYYGPDNTITRGLRFGIESAILDQHVLQRGRIARLLQATQRSPGPKIGLGVDQQTGVLIENERHVSMTSGFYAAVVLDQETYGSAARATYRSPNGSLSIKNVAMHLLPSGPYGYDLQTRQPVVSNTVQSSPTITTRNFEFLRPVRTAGALFITGDLGTAPTGTVASRFATVARGRTGPTVVLVAGYMTDTQAASTDATRWADHLRSLNVTNIQTATLTMSTNPIALATQLSQAGAIFVTARDQVSLAQQVQQLNAGNANTLLRNLWREGTPMLFDAAAAAAVGEWMSAEPVPATSSARDIAASDSFLEGYVNIVPGLGMVEDAVFEPRALYDYRYGRLVSHIHSHPTAVTFGIERNTAIELSGQNATVIGDEAVLVIDGRFARTRAVGTNDAFAATWLLLDTYTHNERFLQTKIFIPLVTKRAAR